MEKKMDETGDYTALRVGELLDMLQGIPPETEVWMRPCRNLMGNMVEAGIAAKSAYTFFGESIPCVIIEPAYTDNLIDTDLARRREVEGRIRNQQ